MTRLDALLGYSRKRRPLAERFWEKVEPIMDDRGCWEWSGYRDKLGYGQVALGAPLRKKILAHRASWLLHFGDPGEMCVLHKCDNPACVNPLHLFVGTMKDNTQDARRKGRLNQGINNWAAKLNPAAVLLIRDARRLGFTYDAIARELGLDIKTVWKAINGLTWTHV
jgi:hypothetical protein